MSIRESEEYTGSFVTLGLFIIDEFSFSDNEGIPSGRTLAPQIGGGGTYASIGARIWLPAQEIGMIVDKGHDFPSPIEDKLLAYGVDMWIFRSQPRHRTTRALNSYIGEHRNFNYMSPRIRISPKDLATTKLPRPRILHFICSPSRASDIVSEIREIEAWHPTTIYEPIPDMCVPEELPALINVLPSISVLSPNAEEALSLLSIPLPPTKASIEEAADRFMQYGMANDRSVIIRSGEMGAYVKSFGCKGNWIKAFWSSNEDTTRIVDVTGAGNSFLGGLAAGLIITQDIFKATFYASVSASFTIEQEGLPNLTYDDEGNALWNGDHPQKRLAVLLARHGC